MRHRFLTGVVLASLAATGAVAASGSSGVPLLATNELAAVFKAPITVERPDHPTRVPIELRKGKIFIDATLNGMRERFFFDTGSPTILTRQLAERLQLTRIGQNTGRDANGRPVTMDVAIVEELQLGDTVFRRVPVLVHDYSAMTVGNCLMEGGVIGSELLPGSVWRIDPEALHLEISAPAMDLNLPQGSVSVPLQDFGYPHAPVLEYRLGDVSDRLLFDTGNSGDLVLFDEVADAPSVQVLRHGTGELSGAGSEGQSAGGSGDLRRLRHFIVNDLQLGPNRLENLQTTSRIVPPTLLGTGLLRSHSVMLDFPGQRFILEPRANPEQRPAMAGYAITIQEGAAVVSQLFDGTRAQLAGLRLGDRVMSLNGRRLDAPLDADSCETVGWLVNTFDAQAAAQIAVSRDGEVILITVPAAGHPTAPVMIVPPAR